MTFHKSMRGAAILALVLAAPAGAVTAPAGYIYSPLLLGSTTQSCVAVGPGGTFVALGPGFTANAQAVVFAQESGAARLVAFGFNAIGDCAYDAATDTLYITDNAAESTGALTGDTVFRVPSASTASGLTAVGLELLPANSVHFAANLAIDSSSNVYVGNSVGNGNGTVLKIALPAPTPAAVPFATGLDLTAGLAFDPTTGDLFVAETRNVTFDNRISSFTSAGTPNGVFAAPSYAFGSYDLAYNTDGRLLATGVYLGDVVSFDNSATSTPFASGLVFSTGVTVNRFTGRVEILSSFSGTAEDRSIHRFTPVDRLVPGKGLAKTECLNEFYGVELVPPSPSKPAVAAICVDGAPCDTDGVVNDRCLFPVGFCLGVTDTRYPTCTPAAIDSLTISVTPASHTTTAAIAAAKASLPLTGPACFFGDGVTVPVKMAMAGKKPGRATVVVKAKAGTATDGDTLALVCQPAP